MKLITAPAVEPISLAEAKAHLRVDSNDEDTRITALIAAARAYCEDATKRVFITQTWELWLDSFSRSLSGRSPWWDGEKEVPISVLSEVCSEIELPKAPLQDLVFVKTFNLTDEESTFYDSDSDTSNLQVDTVSSPGRIRLAYGKSWPAELRRMNAVRIQFTAGYGESGASVPASILQAMYLLIGHWFENREAVVSQGVPAAIKLGVDALLVPHRVVSL